MTTVSFVVDSAVVPEDAVRRIAERFSPDKIILFGSCARGDAGPDSDIDLLVLFPEVAYPNKRAAESSVNVPPEVVEVLRQRGA